MKPYSKFGRAHFYAPYKLIGTIRVDTLWFNMMIMWLATFGLYILLYFNVLRKLLNIFGDLKFK
jgi:hypothetical protein